MKAPDLMINIETLATTAEAVVTQIGLCAFNIDTGEQHYGCSVNLDIQPQLDKGRIVQGSTIYWWAQQIKDSHQCTWLCPLAYDIPVCLDHVNEVINTYCIPDVRVWSHTFDTNILGHIYRMFNVKPAWSYKYQLDIRTLVELAKRYGMPKPHTTDRSKKTHDALDDCKYQVEYCTEAWKYINENSHTNIR